MSGKRARLIRQAAVELAAQRGGWPDGPGGAVERRYSAVPGWPTMLQLGERRIARQIRRGRL